MTPEQEQHEIDRADDFVDREQWERERNCEHASIVTYTIRDWRETGIPEGTVCEDCGKQFPDPPEVEANEPNKPTRGRNNE